jgi:hypothetical protein
MATTISGTSGVTFPAGGVGNPAGTVVGTTDTQTLTNKTLTSPTITGAAVSSMASSVITSGTAVASTSGTSITFSSIPSWVKRITINFNGTSLSGTASYLVQIGSGSTTTTGYISTAQFVTSTGSNNGNQSSTSGFITNVRTATFTMSGTMVLTLIDSNTWVATHMAKLTTTQLQFGGGNSPALAGALDRVVITTDNGTDTFDAGTINILYE